MPTIPAEKLVEGVTENGDWLVFYVESRTPGEEPHRVDLQKYCGNGHCDCDHFKFRLNKHLVRRAMPQPQLECWHIRRAKRYLIFKVLNSMIESREKEAHANQTAAKAKGSLGANIQRPARQVERTERASSGRTFRPGQATPFSKRKPPADDYEVPM